MKFILLLHENRIFSLAYLHNREAQRWGSIMHLVFNHKSLHFFCVFFCSVLHVVPCGVACSHRLKVHQQLRTNKCTRCRRVPYRTLPYRTPLELVCAGTSCRSRSDATTRWSCVSCNSRPCHPRCRTCMQMQYITMLIFSSITCISEHCSQPIRIFSTVLFRVYVSIIYLISNH